MRKISLSLVFVAIIGALLATPVIGQAQQFTDEFTLPGVVNPTACRVGGVVSLEQFTTTGFSNVRIGGPNAEHVAGAWAVANNSVRTTSVVGGRDCNSDGAPDDDQPLNLMGVRVQPTITSAQDADIQEVKLVQDVNLNGQYEPLLDQVLQTKDGSALDSQNGAVFNYGPQTPLAVLGDSQGVCRVDNVEGEGNAEVYFSDTNGMPIAAYNFDSGTNNAPDGEANIFVTLVDPAQNSDPNSRQNITVTVELDQEGVTEDIDLEETGVDTGVFRNQSSLTINEDTSGADIETTETEDVLSVSASGSDDIALLSDEDDIQVTTAGNFDTQVNDLTGNFATNDFTKLIKFGDNNDNDQFDSNIDEPTVNVEVGNSFFIVAVDPSSDFSNSDIEVANTSNGDEEEVDQSGANTNGVNDAHMLAGSGNTTNAGTTNEADNFDNGNGFPNTTSGTQANSGDGDLQLVSGDDITVDWGNRTNDLTGGVAQTGQATNCAMGLLAVVTVGGEPQTGSQFGLQLEALAGNVPGTPRTDNIAAEEISSGFASSQNPQGSNVRLQLVGGTPGSATPITHISNGSGSPESEVRPIEFTGGEAGEGLLSRFRVEEVTPGTREAVAIAVGVCDGANLANTNASVLPQIAGAAPTIAGGLSSLTCVNSDGGDDLLTGLNGATLVFSGSQAEHMGTVRMYADTNANGVLFEQGELVQQVTPVQNEGTDEALAVFGGNQDQILSDGDGTPIAGGAFAAGDPNDDGAIGVLGGNNNANQAIPNTNQQGPADAPLLLVFTVDVNDSAASGDVDVELGLQGFDDTAQAGAGAADICNTATGTFAGNGNCGSNFANDGPATATLSISGEGNGDSEPTTGVAQYDTNGNGVIDDNEFMTAIDDWVAATIQDNLFFDVLNAWVDQTSVSAANVSGLSLNSVDLSSGANGTTFAVSGQAIENTSVDVFSLDGTTVFSAESAGNTLSWNHTASNGQPVANGVYLYRVTVEGANGETVTSEVKKLTVIR